MPDDTAVPDAATGAPKRAGAFDIRNFIAALIGIYGLVLVVAGIVGPSAKDLKKAAGLNINLIAGIGMLLVAALFIAWARWRPIVLSEDPAEPMGGSNPGSGDA